MLAVSGGADSVSLAVGLHELSGDGGRHLVVCHVEHGIRGEASREDARFVRELSGRLGLRHIERSVDVPGEAKRQRESLETAARRVRYEVLRGY